MTPDPTTLAARLREWGSDRNAWALPEQMVADLLAADALEARLAPPTPDAVQEVRDRVVMGRSVSSSEVCLFMKAIDSYGVMYKDYVILMEYSVD